MCFFAAPAWSLRQWGGAELYFGGELGGFYDVDDPDKLFFNGYAGIGLDYEEENEAYSFHSELGYANLENDENEDRWYFAAGWESNKPLTKPGKKDDNPWVAGIQFEAHQPTGGGGEDHLRVTIYLQRDIQSFFKGLYGLAPDAE